MKIWLKSDGHLISINKSLLLFGVYLTKYHLDSISIVRLVNYQLKLPFSKHTDGILFLHRNFGCIIVFHVWWHWRLRKDTGHSINRVFQLSWSVGMWMHWFLWGRNILSIFINVFSRIYLPVFPPFSVVRSINVWSQFFLLHTSILPKIKACLKRSTVKCSITCKKIGVLQSVQLFIPKFDTSASMENSIEGLLDFIFT